MNLRSLSLFNLDEPYSNPAKGYCDWKFLRYLGQVFCMSDNPKISDKYPSLVIQGVRGFPLAAIDDTWNSRMHKHQCRMFTTGQ